MRVLFLGTSEFAVPALRAIAEADRFAIVGVVTQPDKPRGRGRHLGISPVKGAAMQLGLDVHQPRRVRSASFQQWAREQAPDVLVLAAYGQLIPRSLLDLPPLGPINIHGSLLPAYRGAAPIQHALLAGDRCTGVTTMWMEATLDTGDVLMRVPEPILQSDNADTLTARLADAGAALILETLDALAAGCCPRVPQDHARATHAPSIEPRDTILSFGASAEAVVNRVRAMAPRPGAVTSLNGRRLKVLRAEVDPRACSEPGAMLHIERDGVVVSAGDGCVRLIQVQAEGSKPMPASDWARGARIAVGMRFEEIAP